jgi:3D (Asp-Asp-Asp) domain-containing protein
MPGVDSPLPLAGSIRVVRVTEEVVSVLEPLPFETTYEGDPELEIDLQRLISSGAPGVAATTTRIRFEDGLEVGRFEEGRRIARESQPRVVGYGTDIIPRALQTTDGPIQYWRAVTMYATAYSPCHSAADRCYPNTSSGKPVQKGVVAFILRWYRVMRGQAVYIPGYGFATVEDVGGGIPGRYWIDLGYSDSDIVSWNQWVTVYFLTPVPPANAIYWILD